MASGRHWPGRRAVAAMVTSATTCAEIHNVDGSEAGATSDGISRTRVSVFSPACSAARAGWWVRDAIRRRRGDAADLRDNPISWDRADLEGSCGYSVGRIPILASAWRRAGEKCISGSSTPTHPVGGLANAPRRAPSARCGWQLIEPHAQARRGEIEKATHLQRHLAARGVQQVHG
jgi:hypothetical protein